MLSIYDFLLFPRSVLTNLFFGLLCGAPGRVSSVPWSRHLNHSRNCSKIENFCKQTDNTSKHTHTFVCQCVCVFIYTYIWCLFILLIHWTLQLPQLARPASRHRPSPSLFPSQLHFQPDSHSQRDFDLFVGFAMRKWN